MPEPITFGRAIAEARKALAMSQKELAEKVQREEGGPISPQYLNDIEHDRRSPSSDHLVHEFARILKISPDFLYYLAGRLPDDIRRANLKEAQVKNLVAAFRKSTPTRRG